MNSNHIEQKSIKAKCPYCGDASVNHTLTYINDTISILIEPYISFSIKHTPSFIKKLADLILDIFFKILLQFKVITFEEDIEKVVSFRSRVVWEEAKRRSIPMKQIFVFKKPTEHFRVFISNKYFYFESLPIPPQYRDKNIEHWDSKYFLKKRFSKAGLPVPKCVKISIFQNYKIEKIFNNFSKPVIIKPASGSRGRHTTTNIHSLEEFRQGIKIGRMITPLLVVEEHLNGYICRATLVDGKLMGFYRAEPPYVVGDGIKTILELIKEKDENRPERIQMVHISNELNEHIARLGFTLESVLDKDFKLTLYHRTGRLFGGKTMEMLDSLHPSFVPILEKAAKLTTLPITGFDCIVPDPEKEEKDQKWGIIECNTLPYIDLHYYALEGQPKNIAGSLWDLWNSKSLL